MFCCTNFDKRSSNRIGSLSWTLLLWSIGLGSLGGNQSNSEESFSWFILFCSGKKANLCNFEGMSQKEFPRFPKGIWHMDFI